MNNQPNSFQIPDDQSDNYSRSWLMAQSPDSLNLGQRLKRERYLRKMTQEQLADLLKISPSYVGALERGTRQASRKVMDRIHQQLNVSYDYLLEGTAISSSAIAQFVHENSHYTTHHNLNVLLRLCTPQELESCYHLVYTYLMQARGKHGGLSNS